ncbi:GNAT family N-acetyltransferase [Micromonospora palomenae]|uniref:GNAT family N-acetyltransferase n=1 Tax=Micromonospora palomenae TaxID=1461247 RepID=UPI003F893BE8
MPYALPRIRPARWADKHAVAALTADALNTQPLGAWLVPDEHHRRRILTDVLEIWVEHALFFGEVHVADNLAAATVTFHRYRPIPPPAAYQQRLRAAAGANTTPFDLLEAYLHSDRPCEPHCHLATLAVSPAHQRQGLGDALLAYHRQRLDRIGLPAMAEVPPASRRLFSRNGYIPQTEVVLPGGIRLQPMTSPGAVPARPPSA